MKKVKAFQYPGGSPRLQREFKTVSAMVEIYCQAHHDTPFSACAECRALLDYAKARLTNCPFREKKPTCANCSIHCYQQTKQEQVKQVMRFAGPRMLLKHPVLAFYHLLDQWRKAEISSRCNITRPDSKGATPSADNQG